MNHKKVIPIKYQKIIVWIPFINVFIYPAWYYNFFVSKARHIDYFVSWITSFFAALPWIVLGMAAEKYLSGATSFWNIISNLLMHVAVLVLGLVLIRFQERIL